MDSAAPANTRTQWLSISIYPAGVSQPVVITSGSDLGIWTEGEVDVQLNATGGTGAYTWALVSGALPPGLSLRTDGALWFNPPGAPGIIGIATTPGTYDFTLSATFGGQTATKAFHVTITPLNIRDTHNLPDAFVGVPYSHTFHATSSSGVTWSVQENTYLPAGFSLDANGNLTSAGPPTSGTCQVSVVATSGTDRVSRTFQLVVWNVQIPTPGLPNATQGAAYTATVSASGGTPSYTWQVSGLPNGITWTTAADGSLTLSGTPTGPGTWTVNVTATDSSADRRFYTKQFSLNVVGVPPTLPGITTSFNLDDITVGVSRSYSFYANGGTAPYTWSVTNPPPGMELRTTGMESWTAAGQAELWGVVQTEGTYSFDVSMTDSSTPPITVTRTYTLRASPLMLQTCCGFLPGLTYNTLYTAKVRVIGGQLRDTAPVPYTYQVVSGKLPSGMSLASDGTLSGTPAEAGNFNVGLKVTDGGSPAATLSQNFGFFVSGGPSNTVWINNWYQLWGTAGAPFSQTLNACCLPQGYAWQSDNLPSFLTLNGATGVLSGTPPAPGSYWFLVRVSDPTNASNFNVREFVLTVSSLQFTRSSSLPYANVGTPYSATLTATGGAATWSVAPDSALPPGLALDGATGVLSGTPTSPGQFNFNVLLTAGAGDVKSVSLSLAVYPAGAAPPLNFNFGPNLGTVGVGPMSWWMQATSGVTPYHYALSPGAMPITGMRVQDAGPPQPTYFPTTPTQAGGFLGVVTSPGTFSTSIRASDGAGHSIDRPVTFTVSPVAITSLSPLPDPVVGVPYSATLTAAGGTGPYLWALVSGSLPPGLELAASTGVISGTPTAAGSWSPNFTATDIASNVSGWSGLQMNVQPFAITTSVLPIVVSGTPYTATLAGSACPCTWTWSGGLPSGLTFDGSSGTISGTTTNWGTWSAWVTASASEQTARKYVTLFVQPNPVTPIQLNSSGPAVATVGNRYSFSLGTSGGTPPYTWSLVSGGLPTGMALQAGDTTGNNNAPGVWYLVGVPLETGTSNLTLQVTDAASQTGTAALALIVSPITIDGDYRNLPISGGAGTYGALGQPLIFGQAYTQPLLALGGSGVYTWTVVPPGLIPAGLALSADGVVSGTPAVTGTYNVPIRVTDSEGAWYSGNVNFNIKSNATATVTISNGPDLGTYALGSSNNQITLNGSGGTPPYTISLAAGSSLPPGFALVTGTGGSTLLAFTPLASGTFSFTLAVHDSAGVEGGRTFIIRIAQNTLEGSGNLPDATVNTPYSQPLYSWGASVTWSVAPGYALPAGLTLSTDGVLSGTAGVAGTYNFQLRVTDSAGLVLGRNYTLKVSPIAINDAGVLPTGTAGTPYSYMLTGSAGSSFSITSGSLPTGLTLAPTGEITGTTTSTGTYTFTVTASDGTSTVSRRLTLPIASAFPWPLTAAATTGTGTDRVTVTIGRSFSYTLRASAGVPPYTWTLTSGSLPPGLSLLSGAALPAQYVPGTTVIAGMPSTTGTYSFTLTVHDGAGSETTQTMTIVVSPIALLNVLPAATYNVAYSAQLAAVGGAGGYTFALGETSVLPAGLSLSAGGVISGTPTDTGSLSFEVVVNDGAGNSYRGRCNLTVNSLSARTISPSGTIADASLGVYRSITLYANALGSAPAATPFTWSVDAGSSLPPGFTLSSTTGTNGTLTGAPTTLGIHSFRVRVTDTAGNWGVHTYSLVVPPMQIQSVLDDAVVNVAITRPLVVSGAAHSYTVALAPGITNVLPPGLSMSTDGTITGTPTVSGIFSFAIRITDGDGVTFTRTLTIYVWPAPDGIVPLQPNYTAATTASAGAVYTYNLTNMVYGGTAPYRWTLASGSLPPGLQIATGTASVPDYLTGIPTTPGSYNFTLTVTDSSSPAKSRSVAATLTVSALAITPHTAPAATVGTPYSLAFTPSGGTGPLTLTLSSGSSMPPGLTFSGGVLSGTPTLAGRFGVVVTATDSSTLTPVQFSKSFAINVDASATPTPYTSLDQPIVQFNYTQGGPLPAPVSVGITSTSTNVAYSAAVLGVPGASLAAASGTTPGTISIGFNDASALSGLGPGVYGGLVGTLAPQSINRTAIVPVRLTVAAAPVCTYYLSSSSANVDSLGGPATVSVTTDPACTWTATSNAPWLTVTGGGGAGDGTVSYTVAANPDVTPRTGTLTIAGRTFTVTQFGSSCSFAFEPSSVSATAGGSTPTVSIAASNAGCHWTAAASDGWLHITSPASGNGSGQVTFSIDATASPAPRSGSITLSGDATASLPVTQAGISCTVVIGSAGTNVPASGSSGTVEVLSAPCGYTTVIPPQVMVTSGASGGGPGTVAFTVAPNTSTSPRTLTMQIGGQPFNIVQSGVTCSVSLGSANPVYAAGGDSGSIAVTAAASSCGWTVATSATWVILSSGWSGTGDGTVTFSVAPNATTFPRSATVTIGGQSVQVNQAGTACTYSLRSTSGSMPAAGGSSSVGVVAASNCSWTAAAHDSWLSIVASDSAGSGYVYFQAQPNPLATPRTGTLTIAGQTFTVTQAGAPCSYTLSASDTTMGETAGGGSFTFTAGAAGCSPLVQSYSSWIKVTSTFDGVGGTVDFTVQANGSPGARSGRILVGDQTFTVSQLGSTSCTYSLNAWGALFPNTGGAGDLLASATALSCSPAVASSPEIVLGPLSFANDIFTQPYSVATYISPVVWVRVLEINFGGQIFKVKQTSW
jgi:hypothetical protein